MKDNPLKDVIRSTKTQNIMLINSICKEYNWDPDDLKSLLGKKLNKECIEMYHQVAEETINEYLGKNYIEMQSKKKFNINGEERIRTNINRYQPVISNGQLFLHNPITGTNKLT